MTLMIGFVRTWLTTTPLRPTIIFLHNTSQFKTNCQLSLKICTNCSNDKPEWTSARADMILANRMFASSAAALHTFAEVALHRGCPNFDFRSIVGNRRSLRCFAEQL